MKRFGLIWFKKGPGIMYRSLNYWIFTDRVVCISCSDLDSVEDFLKNGLQTLA